MLFRKRRQPRNILGITDKRLTELYEIVQVTHMQMANKSDIWEMSLVMLERAAPVTPNEAYIMGLYSTWLIMNSAKKPDQ